MVHTPKSQGKSVVTSSSPGSQGHLQPRLPHCELRASGEQGTSTEFPRTSMPYQPGLRTEKKGGTSGRVSRGGRSPARNSKGSAGDGPVSRKAWCTHAPLRSQSLPAFSSGPHSQSPPTPLHPSCSGLPVATSSSTHTSAPGLQTLLRFSCAHNVLQAVASCFVTLCGGGWFSLMEGQVSR